MSSMTATLTLPAGLTTRALTMADATAVFETIAAQELVDVGEVEIEEADIWFRGRRHQRKFRRRLAAARP